MPDQNEGSMGPVIATIIILAIVVLGGLYFWGKHNAASAPTAETTQTTSVTPQDAQAQAIQAQSSSDNSAAIQNDLQNTNTSVDTELQAS